MADGVLRQALDSMFVFAGCFSSDGILTDVNRAAADAAGLDREQLLGKRIAELPWWQNLPVTMRSVESAFKTAMSGVSTRQDLEIRVAGGRRMIVDSSISPIFDDDGVVVLVFVSSVDVTDRRRNEEEIRSARDQLRELAAELRGAREDEARRISRELHDQLGSSLTALKWEIESLQSAIAERASGPEQLSDQLAQVAKIAQENIQTVRRIASELRPGIADGSGLVAAVQTQAAEFEARYGITCRVVGVLPNLHLTEEQGTAVFRIVQEALTNVHRHAGASEVGIFLSIKDGVLSVEVSDNGRGIGAIDETATLGVLGMRERAMIAGGLLDIRGERGLGTTISLRLDVSPRR